MDEPGSQSAAFRPLDNMLVRLGLYYGVFLAVVFAVDRLFPSLRDALATERARHVASDGSWGGLTADIADGAGNALPATGETVAVVGFCMLGALALALPVAWVYGWTSRKSRYDKGFAQALLAFPVAVALVVFLVKGSVALAFGLAGIVAAVRFRSQLPETRDAVFLFLVIGIGLAVGVQLVLVAFIASVIFNLTMIAIARFDFGANPRKADGLMLAPPKPKKSKPLAKQEEATSVS